MTELPHFRLFTPAVPTGVAKSERIYEEIDGKRLTGTLWWRRYLSARVRQRRRSGKNCETHAVLTVPDEKTPKRVNSKSANGRETPFLL